MGKQTIKQEARRAALDAQSRRRAERAERERRVEGLALQVLVAIREREAAMRDADRRAGEALGEMVETEGLSTREVVEWCGGEVSAREVARLRRVAAEAAGEREAAGASGGPATVDDGDDGDGPAASPSPA
ncbi:hypothetical protein [Luteipulveratus halotolerans]|uniref:Uncharacterized protein n=1 Tax=Luteipulveratus halotolerans TaxID=1631356 RepID=A0A0L6CD95_9MICO|nr:hypothetical protein [Luteipulveratus halotolerans]KNX35866.1 hypothetical protein VV01_21565 [Luteipulveratus halotolerans]